MNLYQTKLESYRCNEFEVKLGSVFLTASPVNTEKPLSITSLRLYSGGCFTVWHRQGKVRMIQLRHITKLFLHKNIRRNITVTTLKISLSNCKKIVIKRQK